MHTWYLVLEDSSGDSVKITDVPKDVEVVVDDFISELIGDTYD